MTDFRDPPSIPRFDFNAKEEEEYLDNGWIDGEEMAALVTEIIIESCKEEDYYDRPMRRIPTDDLPEWYLSRSNVIDKLRGLVEQRDYLAEMLRHFFNDVRRKNDQIEDLRDRLIWAHLCIGDGTDDPYPEDDE